MDNWITQLISRYLKRYPHSRIGKRIKKGEAKPSDIRKLLREDV
jgi:hypothetical protein